MPNCEHGTTDWTNCDICLNDNDMMREYDLYDEMLRSYDEEDLYDEMLDAERSLKAQYNLWCVEVSEDYYNGRYEV